VVGEKALDRAPELRAMVHRAEVRHLVGDDLVGDVFGRERQPP
jgi:hypothetical protein